MTALLSAFEMKAIFTAKKPKKALPKISSRQEQQTSEPFLHK